MYANGNLETAPANAQTQNFASRALHPNTKMQMSSHCVNACMPMANLKIEPANAQTQTHCVTKTNKNLLTIVEVNSPTN
jgi:hypothetical protein